MAAATAGHPTCQGKHEARVCASFAHLVAPNAAEVQSLADAYHLLIAHIQHGDVRHPLEDVVRHHAHDGVRRFATYARAPALERLGNLFVTLFEAMQSGGCVGWRRLRAWMLVFSSALIR